MTIPENLLENTRHRDLHEAADTAISTIPGTIVESVVAGTNVTVDNTDPANPIVSSSGGGGGSSSYETPGDDVPGSPSSYDDEFNDASIDSKWGWVNQGGATITETNAYQKLTMPSNAGWQYRIRKQTAPGVDFTLTARLAFAAKFENYPECALLLYNSSSTKLIGIGVVGYGGSNWQVQVVRGSTPSSFSAVQYHGDDRGAQYFRIKQLSGSYYFYHSPDGVSWALDYSETTGSFLSSVTDIGFGGAGTNPTDAELTAYWFRVTTP